MKESRREAVLRVCEDERVDADGTDSLVEKRFMEVDALLCERDGVSD